MRIYIITCLSWSPLNLHDEFILSKVFHSLILFASEQFFLSFFNIEWSNLYEEQIFLFLASSLFYRLLANLRLHMKNRVSEFTKQSIIQRRNQSTNQIKHQLRITIWFVLRSDQTAMHPHKLSRLLLPVGFSIPFSF